MRNLILKKAFLVLLTISCSCSESPKTENPVDNDQNLEIEKADNLIHSNQKAVLPVEKHLNQKDESVTYFGTLPCGKCEGIEMWITLHLDQTYSLNTNYLGLNDALEEEFTGKFSYDEKDSIATLEGLKNRYPHKYKIEGNKILQLDFHGKPVKTQLADQYVLFKK